MGRLSDRAARYSDLAHDELVALVLHLEQRLQSTLEDLANRPTGDDSSGSTATAQQEPELSISVEAAVRAAADVLTLDAQQEAKAETAIYLARGLDRGSLLHVAPATTKQIAALIDQITPTDLDDDEAAPQESLADVLRLVKP